jgi:uncharacterized membrane protein YdjX (TVP38/TMEM64 family)
MRKCEYVDKKVVIKLAVTQHPRWIRWIRKASAHYTFPIFAIAIVVLDFFFPVLPSTALLIGGSLLAPTRWFGITVGCSLGSALGALTVATIFQEYGWLFIEWLFGDLKSAPQWQTIEWAIQTYGLFALFIIAVLPMPLRIPTLLTALADISAIMIALIIFSGRLIGYGTLARIASRSPEKMVKWPLIRRSKTIQALLTDSQK